MCDLLLGFIDFSHRNTEKRKGATQYLSHVFETAADKKLASPKMQSRLGTMLGLIGTLIAMEPALAGLSSGDTVYVPE